MQRVKLLGYEIDSFNFQEALMYALNLEKSNSVSQVVTINPEMFETAQNDSDFAQILRKAELVVPDGIGVKIGLKMLGNSIDRIAGIDFAKELVRLSAKNNFPVALIGAKYEVVEKAKIKLEREYKNLNIVYFHDGYFEDNNIIYNELKEFKPRLILVALGSPKQEKFINDARNVLGYGLMIGVGGSFDVWSGTVERAPEIFQKLGLEWLYRTIKEPKRFKRIFPTLPMFLLKVLKEKIKG